VPEGRVEPDQVIGAIHPGDDGLTRLDVLERAKRVDQLIAQPVEFGARTHDSFRLTALQVDPDKSADVARQGEESSLLPIEHAGGPEATELPV
jgi:hypothetical protein